MNPTKTADAGVSRKAVDMPDRVGTTTTVASDHRDTVRWGALSPVPTGHAGSREVIPGYSVVFVDSDSAQRSTRKAELTRGGTQVVAASDAGELADGMRLMEPDFVVVSVSDEVLGGRLMRAVRSRVDAHGQAVPILAWPSPLMPPGSLSELLEAGADMVLAPAATLEDMIAAVHALLRHVESATRRSSRRPMSPAALIDTLPTGVAFIDREGRVCEVNTALRFLWREMTGQPASPVGSEFIEWLVPNDRRTLAEALASLLAAPTGAITDLECSLGTSPLRGIPIRLRMVRSDEVAPGTMIVAQLTDVREIRRAEEQLRATRWRALERQQILDLTDRLSSLSAAAMQSLGSHTAVRADGEMVLSSTHVAMLRGTLTQSEQLYEGLRAIATEREHPAALVDVHALVDTHLGLFRQMLPQSVVLTWNAGLRDIVVRGSESQLQQVLTALVLNAWDAQRSGGAIHVNVHHTEESVRIAVEDEGPGIPDEQADWIFLPMTTTRVAEGASGLGLLNARRTVEMHGGQLRLDRQREHGARFEVELPRYRPRSQEPKSPGHALPTGTGRLGR